MVNAVLHARTLTLRMTLRRARARVNARPIDRIGAAAARLTIEPRRDEPSRTCGWVPVRVCDPAPPRYGLRM